MNWRLVLLVLVATATAQDKPEPPAAFRVGGVVVDRPGARITLWDAQVPGGRYLARAATDARGRFLVRVARETADARRHPFGDVLVVVRGDGLAQHRVVVQAGNLGLKISVRDAKPVEGVVEAADGNPMPAAVVRGLLGGVEEKTTTDENGRFRLVQFADTPRIEVVGEGFVFKSRRLKIRMPATKMVEGRLLDENDKPLVGAAIRDGARVAAVTNNDGKYRVPLPATRTSVVPARYTVHAPGYDTAALTGKPVQQVATVEPLRGRVVDGDGKGVSGARVAIGFGLVSWTDKFGGFFFDALPRGWVDLEATLPGFLPSRVRIEAGIAADRVTLRLLRGGEIEGKVLRDGNPAMGAAIVALDRDRVVALAYSDDQGRFSLRGLPPGASLVRAYEPGRRSDTIRIGNPVTLDLQAQMRLHGTLRSDADGPLAGVKLSCWVEGTTERVREVVTGGNGRFDFGIVDVAEYAVAGAVDKHAPVRATLWPGEAGAISARSAYGDLRFRVYPALDGGARARFRLVRHGTPAVTRHGEGTNWTFATLPAGKYTLTIQGEGYIEYRYGFELTRSTSHKPILQHSGTLHLKASPGAKVIIHTLSGRPAPIAVMELAQGNTSVRGFGPGEYRFIARAEGELIVVRHVTLGSNAQPQDLDLRGGKESRLIVTVVDSAGDPVVGAKVTMMTLEFAAPPKRTDEKGLATLTRLFSGRIRVTASHGERAAVKQLDVSPGKEILLRLTLD